MKFWTRGVPGIPNLSWTIVGAVRCTDVDPRPRRRNPQPVRWPAEKEGVPSFLHEALVDILREHPNVIAELLRRTGTPNIPEHDALVVDRADLGTVIPRELTADCVVRFEREGKAKLVVVFEVQLGTEGIEMRGRQAR